MSKIVYHFATVLTIVIALAIYMFFIGLALYIIDSVNAGEFLEVTKVIKEKWFLDLFISMSILIYNSIYILMTKSK